MTQCSCVKPTRKRALFAAPFLSFSMIAASLTAGFAETSPDRLVYDTIRQQAISDDGGKGKLLRISSSDRKAKAVLKDEPYHEIIDRHARKNGVPLALAHAVVSIESRYNPKARGRAGEVGLMQIKPSTARGLGYKGSVGALYNPETNIKWGMKYLGEAHRLGRGDLCTTILKYNAGHYAKRMNKISSRYCGKVKAHFKAKGISA